MNASGREVEVTRTYLRITGRGSFKPARLDDPALRLERAIPCTVALCQALYRDVGADWHWVDRWQWSEEEWERYVGQEGFGVWLLRRGEHLAGFFELHPDEAGSSSFEISLFGLMPEFVGRGLGGHLLTEAVETAWAVGASQVWLHTCTLDSPAALPNYVRRGFEPYRTETYTARV